MSGRLALHGGTPAVNRPGPHVVWPLIDDESTAAVVKQLHESVSIPGRSGIIRELEERLAEYFQVKHAVLTSSGTAARHSAYTALNLGPGDEVIIPAYTFLATATPLLHLGVRPVLVGCDERGNIDPARAAEAIGPRTKAIVAAHLWGVPADVADLMELCHERGLTFVEDGSHAHGATVHGWRVGAFGRVSAFSMNGPKPLSAGEGGFVLTNDADIHVRTLLHGQYNKRCRQQIPPEHPLYPYATTGMGLKLRIHPLAAALALDQLDRLDERLGGRRWVAAQMMDRLRAVPGIEVPDLPSGHLPSWYALAVRYRPEQLGGLPVETFLQALESEGCVDVDRPGSTCPLNLHPLFQDPAPLFPAFTENWMPYHPGQFPAAENLWTNTIKITIPHDDTPLAMAYVDAFEKVVSHHTDLIPRKP